MEKNLDITKPSYSEHVLPVPWPFVDRGSTAIITRLDIFSLPMVSAGTYVGFNFCFHRTIYYTKFSLAPVNKNKKYKELLVNPKK